MRGFWKCQKVLPTVYDESLSYYEQVCKLREEVMKLNYNAYVHYIKVESSTMKVFLTLMGGEEKCESVDEIKEYMTENGITEIGCGGYVKISSNQYGVTRVAIVDGGIVVWTLTDDMFVLSGNVTDNVV